VKNDEIKTFDDLSSITHASVKSDILGIVNEGLNCYISSVLHLLSESFKDCDLSDHFMICDSNPSTCLACQLIKILNEMKMVKNEIRSVRITGLLDCIYEQMGYFNARDQEDCSEFLQKLLERLECFEECMLLPKITDRFDYQIKTVINCPTNTIRPVSAHCLECSQPDIVNLEGKILYTPFTKSIKKSLESQIESSRIACKCGNETYSRCYFSKLSDFLILSVGRYKHDDQKCIKIEDPINSSVFELKDGANSTKFEIIGCICHKGSEMVSGHYTWWVKYNGNFYTANDSIISPSDEKYSQNGSLFLLKVTKEQK
ncbi:uncharacterized protein VICG_00683, partial [Vittaforma corneae ATCC 50505]